MQIQTQNYSYDKDGLLIQSGDFSISRDPLNGLTTSIADANIQIKQTYNKFGDLKTQKSQLFELKLTRKEARIAKKKETLTKQVPKKNGKGSKKVKETHTYEYTYDNRDRLVEVIKDKKVVEQYSYDANGNRASATVNGVSTTASYTLDDQLVVYGDNTYRYDDDGYLMEKITPEGTTTYSYGTMGELKEVITPTQTITYEHNANNQRVSKEVNGTTVEKYLWANLVTLLATYDANDNLIQRFEYADQRMPISMISNGSKYYLHYDQAGSLRAVSRVLSPDNTSLTVVKEITYDTYGNIVTDTNEVFKVPFGFAGGLYDQDTKLTRFGYRDYDAYIGKWTAKDPIGFGGGDSNLYGYVLGDPVDFFDPWGLDSKLNGRGVPRAMGGDGKGGYGYFKPKYGPFGGGCGTEGSPWANLLPDITPTACEKHDKCYSTCGKSKLMCDLTFLFWSPIYGAFVLASPASKDAYNKAQKHCGECSW